jgi:DNA-binding NarL/FixJ family response regulator
VIRVFILASTPALRAGLRAMLADVDLATIGAAATLTLDLEAAFTDADVLVLAGGSQVAELGAALPDDRRHAAVVLADDDGIVDAMRALPLRGWGVVPTDASPEEMRAAVRSASLGWVSLPGRLLDAALDRARGGPEARPEPQALDQPLTAREVEVLERVSRGLPSKLIARELELSESTVKFHLSSIYTKLGVASRTEAVSRAARLGLIVL